MSPLNLGIDAPVILSLIHELAEHQNSASFVQATETSLLDTLCFATNSAAAPSGAGYAKVLLLRLLDVKAAGSSKHTGEIVGMAIYFNNYSTWLAAPGIYLEDLFVCSSHRGNGYGVLLIKALARETVRIGGKRLEWSCQRTNHQSLKFYRGLGADELDEWAHLRVDGDKLKKLSDMAEAETDMLIA